MRRDWLSSVIADVASRIAAGQRVVIVSSGAIALGAKVLGLSKGGRASLEDAQAAAATGQIVLAGLYAELLGAHGLTAAQMLVTLGDLEDRRRYLNAAATLERLLALGVVPILNENDSVATEEIRFGDNDRLAARVAQAAKAQAVLLLSDVDGLYTSNPSIDPAATLIPTVTDIDMVASAADSSSGSGLGSGGMLAKVQAARIAVSAGAHLAVIAGHGDHPLARFDADGHGTIFVAGEGERGLKTWLAGRLTAHGRLHVDAGAVTALRCAKSLLAAGVRQVEGEFRRGDPVDVIGPKGDLVARGLSAYDAADAAAIAGMRSDEQRAILGYAPRAAMIHRDYLVIL